MSSANQLYINERYKQTVPGMKPKLGSGARFASVANKAAESYENKGMSPEHAKEVGAKIAGKAMWNKYGKKGGIRIMKKGK